MPALLDMRREVGDGLETLGDADRDVGAGRGMGVERGEVGRRHAVAPRGAAERTFVQAFDMGLVGLARGMNRAIFLRRHEPRRDGRRGSAAELARLEGKAGRVGRAVQQTLVEPRRLCRVRVGHVDPGREGRRDLTFVLGRGGDLERDMGPQDTRPELGKIALLAARIRLPAEADPVERVDEGPMFCEA